MLTRTPSGPERGSIPPRVELGGASAWWARRCCRWGQVLRRGAYVPPRPRRPLKGARQRLCGPGRCAGALECGARERAFRAWGRQRALLCRSVISRRVAFTWRLWACHFGLCACLAYSRSGLGRDSAAHASGLTDADTEGAARGDARGARELARRRELRLVGEAEAAQQRLLLFFFSLEETRDVPPLSLLHAQPCGR